MKEIQMTHQEMAKVLTEAAHSCAEFSTKDDPKPALFRALAACASHNLPYPANLFGALSEEWEHRGNDEGLHDLLVDYAEWAVERGAPDFRCSSHPTEQDFKCFGFNTPEFENHVGTFQRPLLSMVSDIGVLLVQLRDELRAERLRRYSGAGQ